MATRIQNKTVPNVGNLSSFRKEKTQIEQKKMISDNNFSFDPCLIAAIMRRNTKGISSCFNPELPRSDRKTLTRGQHRIFKNIYGDIYNDPIKLAMKICDSETPETTQYTDPTRFDVLHCLATNWNNLVKKARQKKYTIPNLNEILDFAFNELKSPVSLHIFILGLPDKEKGEATKILSTKNKKSITDNIELDC